MKVRLEDVRLAFATIWKAEEYETGDGKPRYSCSLLIPKGPEGEANRNKVKQAIMKAGEEKFGAKWGTIRKHPEFKMHAYRDGDMKPYEGFEGHFYVSANRPAKRGRPTVVDGRRVDGKFPPLTEQDGKPYSGCYVNAVVEFYGDNRYGMTMNCGLIALQFARDGEAFSGGASYSDDDFDEVEGVAEDVPWDEGGGDEEDDLLG